jgi:predicted Zn-dependent protease with MMP-like domain
MPDHIELYQRNIESVCRTREEVVEQVRQTLIHEVGHYFGLDERTLRRLESAGKRRR